MTRLLFSIAKSGPEPLFGWNEFEASGQQDPFHFLGGLKPGNPSGRRNAPNVCFEDSESRPPVCPGTVDRKSTRLNSSHTVIYTLSLHDALPISLPRWTQTGQPIRS